MNATDFRKLLEAAGLSQRGAARELEIDERTMRRYCSGELPVPKPVALAVERLAGTIWHRLKDRPITAADAGKIIVGKDKFGNQICGTLIADGFGLIVKEPSSLDSRTISADRVGVYTLLDPPAE